MNFHVFKVIQTWQECSHTLLETESEVDQRLLTPVHSTVDCSYFESSFGLLMMPHALVPAHFLAVETCSAQTVGLTVWKFLILM